MSSFFNVKNDYSFLFGGSQSQATNNQFSLSDYSMIKNGTYKKLMKAYYADEDNSFVNSVAGSKVVSKDDTTELKKLQSAATKLSESAQTLYADKKDLFAEGNEEDLLKAVSAFVKDYNSMLSAADDSANEKVFRAGTSMASNTVANFKTLSSVGIRVNMDSTLSLDEDAFTKASTTAKKNVFSGVGSFAYRVSGYASSINSYAKDDAAKASGTYGAGGSYNSLYDGSSYNSYM